jgi:hypothetical protein
MSTASRAALTAARGRLAIRRELATTPGRLRLAAALLALGAIGFGVVAVHAASTRADAVHTVAATERRLLKAVDLSAHLSAAHATAASSFLIGGPEQAISRRDYVAERRAAARGLAQLADETGASSPGGVALRLITETLPSYAGLIEAARANYRLGFPIGAAYLRRAAGMMQAGRTGMLPSARKLYEIEARSLTAGYEAGVAAWTVIAVAVAGCALLTVLAATQAYIARATRRIVNLGLALSTAVLLVLMGWIFAVFALQHGALVAAQREGSDPIELLTASRILASRAQAEESVGLAARGGGGGEPRLEDVDRGFQALVEPIGRSRRGPARRSGGLLQAAVSSGPPNGAIDAIYDDYRRYLKLHERVVERERVGDYTTAVRLAVGRGRRSSTKAAADVLDHALDKQVRVAQGRYEGHVARAESRLAGLSVGVPLLIVLSALLALSGVRQRLEEYR